MGAVSRAVSRSPSRVPSRNPAGEESQAVEVVTRLHFNDQSITSYSKAADTTSYTLGVVFQFLAAGTVDEVSIFKPSGANQDANRDVAIWDHATGTLLASGSGNYTTEAAGPAWITVPLTASITVAAMDAVIVGALVKNGGYASQANAFASAVDSGSIRAPASANVSGNGRFHAGATLALPTDFFNATNYYVDVSFTPA